MPSEAERQRIVDRLGGEAMALVSDAGTPLISDPGYKLVRAAREAGHAVHTVPGPSAAIAALTLAGASDRPLPVRRLPAVQGQGREPMQSPSWRGFARRWCSTRAGRGWATRLLALADQLGDRDAAVAREITKLHEECVTGTLDELAKRYSSLAPKGEIVIVVGSARRCAAEASEAELDAALDEALAACRHRGPLPRSPNGLRVPRKRAYARALERAK